MLKFYVKNTNCHFLRALVHKDYHSRTAQEVQNYFKFILKKNLLTQDLNVIAGLVLQVTPNPQNNIWPTHFAVQSWTYK